MFSLVSRNAVRRLALRETSAIHCSSSSPSFPRVEQHRQQPLPLPRLLKRQYLSNAEAKLQRTLWDSYLASGRGAQELFDSIDVDSSAKITSSEVSDFLSTVPHDGIIREEAFASLQSLADDHELDLSEFRTWLVEATKFHGEGSVAKDSYESHPDTGYRSADEIERDWYSWNEDSMSQGLRRMQYAVRGEIVMRAEALQAEGKEIIYTNIGNPHAVGQSPITFYRQVLALCDLPAECGVDHPDAHRMFPADVLERAREYREAIGPAGTGAYTHSQGLTLFRQHVADYIAKRDGHPSYPGDIFLSNGASAAIQNVLTALIACDRDGIMIPIPQYPIYSALITLLGGRQVGYELDEEAGWAAKPDDLDKALESAKHKGLLVKAMAIINPGNPTGQVLTRESLETICLFCAENDIVLLADEVYQRNVYVPDKTFVSAKKVAIETPGCEHLQLVSFHSTSKGLIGECGRRGGYMELHGIDPAIHAHLYKLASSGLCSGVAGQVMTSLMVHPPQEGGESYDKFIVEEGAIFGSLARRSSALVDGLNAIDGVECQRAEGAMYAFPSIQLPEKAIKEAESKNQTPDTLYALSLLEETGICVVPASGFGQRKGRIGFRTTFLPPEEQLMGAIGEFKRHHELFCKRYE